MEKTNDYTREERDQLWDIALSVLKSRNAGIPNYYQDLSELAYKFKSGNILDSSLLPKSAWIALNKPYEDIPLYINDPEVITAAIALWRLQIGR